MSGDAQTKTCCPKFDPTSWDEKTYIWDNKMFIKESIPVFFHIPLPWMLQRMISRMWNRVQEAKAAPDLKDFLLLSFDPSPWKSEYYMAVTGKVSGAEHVELSGTYLSRVFDGPYRSVPQWMEEMNAYVAKQNKMINKLYFYFTTCPKCAKNYGHNYVVAFARID
ncbi:MAG: hydrolase [Bacillota bacterium]